MKYFSIIAITMFFLVSCNEASVEEETTNLETEMEITYASFGEEITPGHPISAAELLVKMQAMDAIDTLENIKFTGEIGQVCQKKGCWMRIAMNEDEDIIVRFKDYGFFMPFNADGSMAIVEGRSFIRMKSVEELQLKAQEAGESEEEILAITAPEIIYEFIAHGVLIEE
ncbi:MAG: DUF4920 domain-containing protein [Crocinitomicaceae bacterium]|nr:DUF4920 domain-containing protein [Crocinitomicaceae bacterium]